MSSLLGDRVARIFDEVPRLRFDKTSSRAEVQVWAEEVQLLMRRHVERVGDLRAEIADDRRIGGLPAQALFFRVGDEARWTRFMPMTMSRR